VRGNSKGDGGSFHLLSLTLRCSGMYP